MQFKFDAHQQYQIDAIDAVVDLFEGQPRIVQLRDYRVDFVPEEHMLLITYLDRPGMIGKIGQVMGEHDINIAAMNLGRQEKQDEAMVILSLDSAAPANVVEEIGQTVEANFIKYLHMVKAKAE